MGGRTYISIVTRLVPIDCRQILITIYKGSGQMEIVHRTDSVPPHNISAREVSDNVVERALL